MDPIHEVITTRMGVNRDIIVRNEVTNVLIAFILMARIKNLNILDINKNINKKWSGEKPLPT